eukprot:tig00021719_g23160.t1
MSFLDTWLNQASTQIWLLVALAFLVRKCFQRRRRVNAAEEAEKLLAALTASGKSEEIQGAIDALEQSDDFDGVEQVCARVGERLEDVTRKLDGDDADKMDACHTLAFILQLRRVQKRLLAMPSAIAKVSELLEKESPPGIQERAMAVLNAVLDAAKFEDVTRMREAGVDKRVARLALSVQEVRGKSELRKLTERYMTTLLDIMEEEKQKGEKKARRRAGAAGAGADGAADAIKEGQAPAAKAEDDVDVAGKEKGQ